MAQIRYKNIDLGFHKSNDRYIATIRSFKGETKQPITFPFTIKESVFLLQEIERGIYDRSLSIDSLKKFGGDLFESVFVKDIRAIFKNSIDSVEENLHHGLRIRLHLQDVPELNILPWEYLYQESINQFLCLYKKISLVRYTNIPKTIPKLTAKPPLRILVVLSNPLDHIQLNIDKEKKKISEALYRLKQKKLIEIVFLENATLSKLQRAIRNSEYHILHFIGHGEFDHANNIGSLVFINDQENAEYINAERLGTLLVNSSSIRLVVLNNCQGATTSSKNPFAGTSFTLLQQGIPAVAAMQFSISDGMAVKFASEFYSAISDGNSVDEAIIEARLAIYSSPNNNFEWGTPVLFMRSQDGNLFEWNRKEHQDLDEAKENRKDGNKPPPYKFPFILILSVSIISMLISIFILWFLPETPLVDLKVFAERVNFSVPKNNQANQIFHLLSPQNVKRVNSIKVFDFQPINISIESSVNNRNYKNPITIIPNRYNNRIQLFSQDSKITVQEIYCDSTSHLSYHYNSKQLFIEINESAMAPSIGISLKDTIGISTQACKVIDGEGTDITRFFEAGQLVNLKNRSKSINIRGTRGKLRVSLTDESLGSSPKTQYLHNQAVENLNFNKFIYGKTNLVKTSTIDSILISSPFSSENLPYSFQKDGEISIISKPSKFLIVSLEENNGRIKVHAKGKVQSFKVGSLAAEEEQIPAYLAFFTSHPTILLGFTWIICLLIIIIAIKNKGLRNA